MAGRQADQLLLAQRLGNRLAQRSASVGCIRRLHRRADPVVIVDRPKKRAYPLVWRPSVKDRQPGLGFVTRRVAVELGRSVVRGGRHAGLEQGPASSIAVACPTASGASIRTSSRFVGHSRSMGRMGEPRE